MLPKYKRCHHFNKRGRPVGNGCARTASKCRFVHPDEPEWDDLPPVPPPPSHSTRRRTSDYQDRPRSPSRNRRHSTPSPPPPLLLNRISPHHVRSRSPLRSPSGFGPRHRSPSPMLKSPVSLTTSRFRPNRTETNSSVANKEAEELRDRRGRTDSVSSSILSHNLKGATAMGGQPATRIPRAPPQTSSNMQGAPTMTGPSSSSVQGSTMSTPLLPPSPVVLTAKQPRAELSNDQKRKIWAELVRLFSDTLQQRSKLVKIDGDISVIKRVASLRSTGPVPDASRASAEAKTMELETQRGEELKNYDALFSRLVATENWPVTPPVDNNDREAMNKVTKYCEELLRKAEEISGVLSSDTCVGGDPSRPLKRRRVDEGGQEEKQHPQAVANSEAYEELRDRILAMHETTSSIQNYQTTIRNDLVAEYKEYADTKIEEATVEVTKNIQVVEEKIVGLNSNLKSTGDDVGELAGEIEKLIIDNGSLRTEIAETRQRIRDSEARITQLEQRLQDLANGRNQFAKTIEALKAAHAAHVARPMSPPISPSMPPIDYIVQMVQDPLLEAARSAIKPLLVDTKEDIQGLLKERSLEMYQTLFNGLVPAMKLVDVLSARLTPTNSDGVNLDAT